MKILLEKMVFGNVTVGGDSHSATNEFVGLEWRREYRIYGHSLDGLVVGATKKTGIKKSEVFDPNKISKELSK